MSDDVLPTELKLPQSSAQSREQITTTAVLRLITLQVSLLPSFRFIFNLYQE
jgi:hypothetical protein